MRGSMQFYITVLFCLFVGFSCSVNDENNITDGDIEPDIETSESLDNEEGNSEYEAPEFWEKDKNEHEENIETQTETENDSEEQESADTDIEPESENDGDVDLEIEAEPDIEKEVTEIPEDMGFHLYKDLNIKPTDRGKIISKESINSKYLMTVMQPETGMELWVTDGTEQGTKLIKDVNPGTPSAFEKHDWDSETFTFKVENQIYFIPSEHEMFSSLWITDGTEAGTRLVKKFNNTDRYHYLNGNFAKWNGKLYFKRGFIWESDGTESGTKILLKPDEKNPFASMFISNGVIYFIRFNLIQSKDEYTFWSYNIQTKESKQIIPFTLERIGHPVELNGDIYITGVVPNDTLKLFKYNPEQQSFSEVYSFEKFGKNIGCCTDTGERLYVSNNKLYFSVDSEKYGEEPWVSDGTTQNTRMIKDLIPGKDGSTGWYWITYKDKMYFTPWSDDYGFELWATDGTKQGTMLVKDIWPGQNSGLIQVRGEYSDWIAPSFTIFDNKLYFNANDGVHGQELWVTDGTTDGTKMVKDIIPGEKYSTPQQLSTIDDGFIFTLQKDMYESYSNKKASPLWFSDGTKEGTKLVSNYSERTIGSNVTMKQFDNMCLFEANLDEFDTGTLFSLNSINSEPQIIDTYQYSFFRNSTLVGNYLYSKKYLDSEEMALSKLNIDTGVYTDIIKSKNKFSVYSKLFKHNTDIFYITSGENDKLILYLTDTTDDRVEELSTFSVDPYLIEDVAFYEFSSKVFMVLGELYTTNGTKESTKKLTDINPSGDAQISSLFFYDTNVIFSAKDSENTQEIWSYNILTQVLRKITNFKNDTNFRNISDFHSTFHGIVFSVVNNDGSFQFWITDGTESNTKQLSNFDSVSLGYSEYANDTLYFFIGTKENVLELWQSKWAIGELKKLLSVTGSNNGTSPYIRYNKIGPFVHFGNKTFFAFDDEIHGNELWVTDGTEDGTHLYYEFAPGEYGTSDMKFYKFDGHLLVVADDGVHGREIWVSDFSIK